MLLPGLSIAAADRRSGQIDATQVATIQGTTATVAAALTQGGRGPMLSRRRRSRDVSLLDANLGAHLRQMREARQGRWQGSLDVPLRSVVLCAGLPGERDAVLSELLVRSLREADVDARSATIDRDDERPDPDKSELVSTIFLPYPLEDQLEPWIGAATRLRDNVPHALLATIRLSIDTSTVSQPVVEQHVDIVLRSFEEALAFVAPERSAKWQGTAAAVR